MLDISFAVLKKKTNLLQKKTTVPRVRKHAAVATEIERSNRASAEGRKGRKGPG